MKRTLSSVKFNPGKFKFKFNLSKFKSGFTLVELMVSVAIIGVLASIAIPAYKAYQIRSRQSEAKLALAGIYQVQEVFFADVGTFSTCLGHLGFQMPTKKRYYHTGFSDSSWSTNCGPNSLSTCNVYAYSGTVPVGLCVDNTIEETYFPANAQWNSNATWCGASNTCASSGTVSQDLFTICSFAYINVAATGGDRWCIDQNKVLVNLLSGI